MFFFQIEHLRSFILFRFSMGFIDSMVAKCELTSDFLVPSSLVLCLFHRPGHSGRVLCSESAIFESEASSTLAQYT